MAEEQQTGAICGQCRASNRVGAGFCRSCGSAMQSPVAAQSLVAAQSGARIKRLLLIAVNPGIIIRNHLADYSWPWALGVSGLAFMLFFLQTGLDLSRAHKLSSVGFVGLAIIGVAYGTVGVSLLAGVAWLGCRATSGAGQSLGWAVRAFGLSYSPTLVYVFLGLLANLLLGWNTAVAFGITGALWAMNPMNAAIREMTAGKVIPSLVITSVCGGVLLFGWALIGTR